MKTKKNSVSLLAKLLETVKNYKGLTRKALLADLLDIVEEKTYDDAGSLEIDGKYVVVSTDGIVESLVKEDPWLAGFYSVVVNVNDVVAKGANPAGYACVVSSKNPTICRQIIKGVKYGLDKYRLKFLKGHTHPDTSFDAVDAAVIGFADNFLSSTGAKPQDSIVVAIDLDGKHGNKGWVRTFDSVKDKSSQEVRRQLKGIIEIAKTSLASASRDISGPGIVGTVGMLCESSNVGANLLLDVIPKPEKVELNEWLITYPSTGFIFTTSQPKKCMSVLNEFGFTTRVIGEITETQLIKVFYEHHHAIFMDLRNESIFGFKKSKRRRINERNQA